MMKALHFLYIATALVASIPQVGADIPFFEGDPNFLFIGNSYTQYNALAEMAKSVLQNGISEWESAVSVKSYNPPGRTLSDHLDIADGTEGETAMRMDLVTKPLEWKWVVMQDQVRRQNEVIVVQLYH